MRALDRLTEEVNGERRIVENAPLIVREQRLQDGTPITEALDALLRSYMISLPKDRRRLVSRYRVVDVARKVVGVGSGIAVIFPPAVLLYGLPTVLDGARVPFASEEDLRKFIIALILDVCDRNDITPCVPLGNALYETIRMLLYWESILIDLPEESSLRNLTIEEGVVFRAALSRACANNSQ
jgi:hypothetical protein